MKNNSIKVTFIVPSWHYYHEEDVGLSFRHNPNGPYDHNQTQSEIKNNLTNLQN